MDKINNATKVSKLNYLCLSTMFLDKSVRVFNLGKHILTDPVVNNKQFNFKLQIL